MNKIIIIGRLTRNPEISYTQSGMAKCILNVAVDSAFKDKSGNKVTTFFRVQLWGKTAEVANDYSEKGKQVCIEGEMRRDEWTDKNGEKKTSWYINGSNLQLLGSKGDGQTKRRIDDTIEDEISDRTIDEELERNQPYGF